MTDFDRLHRHTSPTQPPTALAARPLKMLFKPLLPLRGKDPKIQSNLACLNMIPLSLYWSLRSRASYIIWFQDTRDTSTRKSTDIHPSLIINHPTVLLVAVNKNHHFPTDFHQFHGSPGWCPSQNFPVPGAGENAWKQPVCLWLFYFHIRKCEKNILPICCAKEF